MRHPGVVMLRIGGSLHPGVVMPRGGGDAPERWCPARRRPVPISSLRNSGRFMAPGPGLGAINRPHVCASPLLTLPRAEAPSRRHDACMTPAAQPLPPQLQDRPFLRSEAIAHGISVDRLRRSDVTPLGPGLYVPAGLELTASAVAIARSQKWRACAISGVSAAQVFAFLLPSWLANDGPLAPTTMTVVEAGARPTASAIRLVRDRLDVRDVLRFRSSATQKRQGVASGGGLIMTRPRTWLSLATVVPFDFLVAIADHLIRVPRPQFEKGRTEPYSSVAELRQLLERYKGVKGVAIARRALGLARVGAVLCKKRGPVWRSLRRVCLRQS